MEEGVSPREESLPALSEDKDGENDCAYLHPLEGFPAWGDFKELLSCGPVMTPCHPSSHKKKGN